MLSLSRIVLHIGIRDIGLLPIESLAATQGCALQPLCHRPLERWRGSFGCKHLVRGLMSSRDEFRPSVTSRPLCAGLDKP
jgi:hypothetical protein